MNQSNIKVNKMIKYLSEHFPGYTTVMPKFKKFHYKKYNCEHPYKQLQQDFPNIQCDFICKNNNTTVFVFDSLYYHAMKHHEPNLTDYELDDYEDKIQHEFLIGENYDIWQNKKNKRIIMSKNNKKIVIELRKISNFVLHFEIITAYTTKYNIIPDNYDIIKLITVKEDNKVLIKELGKENYERLIENYNSIDELENKKQFLMYKSSQN